MKARYCRCLGVKLGESLSKHDSFRKKRLHTVRNDPAAAQNASSLPLRLFVFGSSVGGDLSHHARYIRPLNGLDRQLGTFQVRSDTAADHRALELGEGASDLKNVIAHLGASTLTDSKDSILHVAFSATSSRNSLFWPVLACFAGLVVFLLKNSIVLSKVFWTPPR